MKRLRRHEKGQAVVEFALILPLFLLLVFAITEFGRVWMIQHVITTASRAGCRRGILPSSDFGEIETIVNDFCAAASLDLARVDTLTNGLEGGFGAGGDTVEVTVTYDFQVLSGSIISALQGSIQLNSTTRMRHE